MKPFDAALAILTMAIWGVNFTTGKAGIAEIPPLLMMAVRFVLVALLLIPFVARPHGRMRDIFLLSATLGTAHFGLMFLGLRFVDAGTAAIVAQLQVPFSAAIAAIVFKDRMGWRRILGLVLAFGGIVVLAGGPTLGEHPWAISLVIAASLVWALANIQIKRMGPIDGFALNGWMGLFAAPQLLLLSLVMEDGHVEALLNATWRGWGSLAFMVLMSTIVGYGLWYRLLRHYPVSHTVPYMLLVPLFGVLSGWLLLGEPLSWQKLIGGAITVTGVAIILVRRPRVAEPTVREADAQGTESSSDRSAVQPTR